MAKEIFGSIPSPYGEWDHASIAVLSVPYDATSSWIKGADKGPKAIIHASTALELYDIETDSLVYKKGIFTCDPLELSEDPAVMNKEVYAGVKKLIDAGKFVVMLGGEHSITLGSVQAHKEKWKNLSVLQIDAHSDLRNTYHGVEYSHACVMYHVNKSCPIVQVGIRSMGDEELPHMDKSRVYFAHDIIGKTDWISNVVDQLTDEVYVTIDLDGFDPSYIPSTGTPEPGGLDWYTVIKLLKAVCAKRKVVGFDVVELCPNPADKSSDFIAAKLIYTFLTYVFQEKS